MPLTLADAKATMQDKVEQTVIDEFRRGSLLLDRLTFDDAVSPGTGGSTLTYAYTRLKTPSMAASRALNAEYTPGEAVREKSSTELKIFGGSFEIDRVIAKTSGALNEIDFQLQQKITAARNYLHYQVINGDSAADANTFDGLDKLLTGSTTESGTGAVTDLSATVTQATALAFLEQLDNFLANLNGKPDMLFGNKRLINKIVACARVCNYLTRSEDAFGRRVLGYNDIPLVDLGYYYNGTATVDTVPVRTRTVATVSTTGLTDLYAVSLGLDSFHGVTPQGGVGLSTFLPDLSLPGAVKTGEVEMVMGVALKQTLKAGVLRNIKVQ